MQPIHKLAQVIMRVIHAPHPTGGYRRANRLSCRVVRQLFGVLFFGHCIYA
jgi:hypothetical protein